MAVLILPLRFEKKVKGVLKTNFFPGMKQAHLPVKKYARFVLSYVNQCVLKKYKGGYKSEAVFVRFDFIRPVLFL